MLNRGKFNVKIVELQVSEEFKVKSSKLGIDTIGDLMDADFKTIKLHPEYSVLWYSELIQMLRTEGLLETFEEKLV